MYPDDKDDDLVLRMAHDDDKAFTSIYNKYWKLMFSVACKKLDNPAEAEGVVQDIFLDLWKRRAELQLNSHLSPYLSVAVNYRVFKILARRQLYAKYKEAASANQEVSYQMETVLEFEEVKEKLFQLVTELPKKCRLVFQMSREQSMTGKEIARELRISEKTVESHITKALHHLKTGFGSLLLIFLAYYSQGFSPL